ncbi:MAG: PQQ-like beta-propeller repeat protein [Opitutaceae bacterium]|nr:PQQ-like beta-propeller repeat protein [Verrucomicrobiales bacterium]
MKTLLSMALIALTGTAIAADWPQFLGPTRSGISAETTLATTWPKDGPRTVWSKSIGEGFAGPVAAGGKVVLFHRLGDREIVEQWELTNAAPVWKFEYITAYTDDYGMGNGPRATPTVQDGKIYTFGAEGVLHCLDFKSGEKLWSVDTRKDFNSGKGFFGPVCSPLVEGSAVLLNIGGTEGAGIVAFDKETGKLLWKSTDDEASYSSPVAATIAGERRAVFFTRSGLAVLNPSDGKVQFTLPWQARTRAAVNAASPTVVNDEILLSSSYDTGAILLKISSGKLEKIWSNDESLSNHYSTSVYHRGFLYGFDGRQEEGCRLRCVEWKTGKVRWTQDRTGSGWIVVVGDQLLVLTEHGELIQAPASPDGFKPTNRAQIVGSHQRAAPAFSNGYFVARDQKNLACVDLQRR